MGGFLADRMLGQTAKWLRLMGIDTEYAPDVDDDELLQMARREDRILITRDKDLEGHERVFMVDIAPAEEIIPKILEQFEPDIEPLTRCSKCNGEIEEVDKGSVEGKVPERVFGSQDVFWVCEGCGQIYWRGTHWDDILKKIEEIKRRV